MSPRGVPGLRLWARQLDGLGAVVITLEHVHVQANVFTTHLPYH